MSSAAGTRTSGSPTPSTTPRSPGGSTSSRPSPASRAEWVGGSNLLRPGAGREPGDEFGVLGRGQPSLQRGDQAVQVLGKQRPRGEPQPGEDGRPIDPAFARRHLREPAVAEGEPADLI